MKRVEDMTPAELRAIGDAGRLRRLEATNPELLEKARAWARLEQERAAARQRAAETAKREAAARAEQARRDAAMAVVRRVMAAAKREEKAAAEVADPALPALMARAREWAREQERAERVLIVGARRPAARMAQHAPPVRPRCHVVPVNRS